MSKSKIANTGKWLAIASIASGAVYATQLWFFEPTFWLTLAGLALVPGLSALHLYLLSDDFSAKNLMEQVRTARQHVEPNTSYEIIRVVAFAKLWFRKQFPLIDLELQRLKPSLLRLGLEGVREGYEEAAIRNMMQAHAREQNAEAVALHGKLTSLANHLPNLAILAAITVLTPALILSEGVLGAAQLIPVLSTFSLSLILASLVIKPLLQRIERQTLANEKSMQLVIEGVVLILHKRTPAMIRSTLETMANPHAHEKQSEKAQEKTAERIPRMAPENDKISALNSATAFSLSQHAS